MTETKRRTDDSFIRKVGVAMILIIIGQGGSIIFLMGNHDTKINANGAGISANSDYSVETRRQLAAHIEKSNDKLGGVILAVGRLELITETMVKTVDKMEMTVSESVKNQNQIMPTVKRADSFITNHDRQFGTEHEK